MTEKLLSEMSYDEFLGLIDEYIERSSQQTGEMPASTFFELLFERLAGRTNQTVEVMGRIVNNELVLSLPEQESSLVQVQGNQIVVGNQKIVVKLELA